MPRKVKIPENGRRAAYLAGELSVSDMDDDELARGQWKDKGGLFRGGRPNMPSRFTQELSKELLRRTSGEYRSNLLKIAREQVSLALEAENEAVRMKAGQYITDRELGKAPEKVYLAAGRPEWEDAVDDFVGGMERTVVTRAAGEDDEVAYDEKLMRASEILGRRPKMVEGNSRPAKPTADPDAVLDSIIRESA